jgi:hypothetical protein
MIAPEWTVARRLSVPARRASSHAAASAIVIEQEAAVDGEARAGDVGSLVGAEEDDRVRSVFRLAWSRERKAGHDGLERDCVESLEVAPHHFRHQERRKNLIDADAVLAALGRLTG